MTALYRADLHLHSVLSPCADLQMGPYEIIKASREASLDVIAITDHNSCMNYPALAELAGDDGPLVICGMEVQTVEDVHIVTLFPSYQTALICQRWLWSALPEVQNRVDLFGYQLVVDKEGNILEEVDRLLLQGALWTVDDVISMVHDLGGLAILAHIDRPSFSYPSVLGFIPEELEADALELSKNVKAHDIGQWRNRYRGRVFLRSSDAHRVDDIGSVFSQLSMEGLSFDELAWALKGVDGREVLSP